MRRHYLTSVAAIALALGMTAAGAQNVDRNSDPGKQTDQNNHQPQISGQSHDTASQQGRDPDKRQDTQNATDRQQDNPQSEQGSNQQQGAQRQNAPVTSGQSRDNAREPQRGQNPQQGAQAQQPSTQNKSGQDAADRQQGDRQPGQMPNQQQGAQQQNAPVASGQSQENAREPQQGQNPQQGARAPQPARSQQGAQEPRQGGEKQQGAENEQPDKSGRIALDESEQMRIGDIIRQQRIKPVTNLDFSLSAGSTVPASVRLSRISGELAEIFPHYRDFSFFVARQELVIVDSQSYGIVGFVPISGGGTVGTAAPREEKTGTVGTAGPREEKTGTVGTATAEPPAPTKKKVERPEKKRVTEEKPRVEERETIRRSPAHTETDVTVGTSRREIEEFDGPPPRDRDIGPPVRERFERDEGPPFPFSLPFSLFFGRPN
jgi:hypothetical protein